MSNEINLSPEDACIQKTPNPPKEYHPWQYENTPWTRIHLDFAEYKKQHFLLMVDGYSKWLEIYQVSSMTAGATIEKLRDAFSRFGIPRVVVTDNGPPFHSEEFLTFLNNNGIIKRYSAPYHPSSNGQVERYVRTFKEAMVGNSEESIKTRISRFLLSYRRTPNSTTGYSPAELMFGRRIRSRLDLLKFSLTPARENQLLGQRETKTSFEEGEEVLIRIYQSEEKWIPGKVTRKQGDVNYWVRPNGAAKSIIRHINQLRKIVPQQQHHQQPQIDDVESIDETTTPETPEQETRQSTRESRPPKRYIEEC